MSQIAIYKYYSKYEFKYRCSCAKLGDLVIAEFGAFFVIRNKGPPFPFCIEKYGKEK